MRWLIVFLLISSVVCADEITRIGGGGSGGDALTTNPLSQFAATTSLQLLGVLSDETGTGAAVFATSPVFTTPNIGTATGSVSGNAGTATALASNPSDCAANQFANTIAASGNLTCAAIADGDVPNTITIDLAAAATALASNPTDCGANTFATTIDASGNLTCSEPTLGTSSAGNYVASVATTAPLAGGAAGSEGAAISLSVTANGIGPTEIDETATYALSSTSNTFVGASYSGPAADPADTCIFCLGTAEKLAWEDTTEAYLNYTTASDDWSLSGPSGMDVGINDTSPDFTLDIFEAAGGRTIIQLADGDVTGISALFGTSFASIGDNATLWLASGNAISQGVVIGFSSALDQAGLILAGNQGSGTTTVPGIRLNGAKSNGTGSVTSLAAGEGIVGYSNNSGNHLGIFDATGNHIVVSGGAFAWSSNAANATNATIDTKLTRSSAGLVKASDSAGTGGGLTAPLLTGTTSVTSPIFSSNAADPPEAGILRCGNAETCIAAEASPAGTDGTITFNATEQWVIPNTIVAPSFLSASGTVSNYGTQGNDIVNFKQNNATVWKISVADVLQPEVNNVSDLGTSSERVRSGFFGTSVNSAAYITQTDCADSAGNASCAASAAGFVVIDAADTDTQVSTTAMTAVSQVFVQEDSSLSATLGVTCNTTISRTYVITARTVGTFTITASAAPTTNPACLSYWIVN